MTELAGPRRGSARVVPFGPGSMLWDVIGEWRAMFTFPGALLMQVMHPEVGAAVGRHSVFRTDPWGRLERSLDAVVSWVYEPAAAYRQAARLRAIHRGISGLDDRGRPYHALHPEPYAWVHATAYERFVATYRYFYRPLDRAQERRLYAETLQLGRMLGVAERELPPTVEAYWEYFHDVVANRLEDHPTAHDVLACMRRPVPPPALGRFAPAWRPVGYAGGRLQTFLTIGTLSPAIRDKLGLGWTAADERRLRRFAAMVRATVPRLPEPLRYIPQAAAARRHAAGWPVSEAGA